MSVDVLATMDRLPDGNNLDIGHSRANQFPAMPPSLRQFIPQTAVLLVVWRRVPGAGARPAGGDAFSPCSRANRVPLRNGALPGQGAVDALSRAGR